MSIKRHIPNTITCLNLFFGCIAVLFALKGWLLFAVVLVVMAAVFDFCDGLAARLLKAYSPMGKELDSLADLVSFGLAPAAMMHYEFAQILNPKISYGAGSIPWELLSFFPFILVVASALRLAKFNIDTRQSEQFIGLPTPASALFISSILLYLTATPTLAPFLETPYTIPAISLFVSYLMVSNVPMFSLKVKALTWKGNQVRVLYLALIIALVVLTLVLGWPWSLAALLALCGYLLLSLLLWISPPAYAVRDKEAGSGGAQTR